MKTLIFTFVLGLSLNLFASEPPAYCFLTDQTDIVVFDWEADMTAEDEMAFNNYVDDLYNCNEGVEMTDLAIVNGRYFQKAKCFADSLGVKHVALPVTCKSVK